MLILTEYSKPYLIETSNAPIVPKFFWAFTSSLLDFTLHPLFYLEETTGTMILLEVNGLQFRIPYTWYIMVSDNDTQKLDYMPIADCITIEAFPLVMTPADSKFRTTLVKVIDVIPDEQITHPMLQKGTALCHPVGDITLDDGQKTIMNVVIGPHDLYKHLDNMLYGDLI